MSRQLQSLLTILVPALLVTPLVGLTADQPVPVNRLLKQHTEENRLLKEDGIHDPANAELSKLKEPTKELSSLEPAKSGNFVDWAASLKKGTIKPQYDAKDPAAIGMPMDLDVLIEVKGSTQNVLFPHAAHLQWLECNNCHTAIFQPKKGANKTSMEKIMKGESCGVCHGSVAFPVNDCERCHSQKK